MKNFLLIVSIGLVVTACTSSEKIVSTAYDYGIDSNPQYTKKVKVDTIAQRQVPGQLIHNKINTIIEKYLGVPITSTARSLVIKTETGYQWKFMNVKTGENFNANSDLAFSFVQITKK